MRLSYDLAGEGDPLNPRSLPKGWGIGRAYVELPAAAPQYGIEPREGVAKGKLTEEHIQSKILKAERMAWIYTPAGYDPRRVATYPLLVCFDGSTYTHQVPTPVILDNLIADGKIPPTVAVFIAQSPQPQRNIELSNNAPFADFVAGELLPQVRSGWRVTADPAKTVVCGSSAGGLAALFFAFRRPDVFGNVLAQSAALWPGKERENPDHEWLIQQYEGSPKLPVRFVLQPGVVEVVETPLHGPSIINSNRRLHDILRKKGYEVGYSEVPGGHEPLTWRGGIAPGLIRLLGKTD
jgi:enterochelin esterase family protein